MAVIVWYLDQQLSVQSVPITTNVVSSNSVHGEVYSIYHYVIKYVTVNDCCQLNKMMILVLNATFSNISAISWRPVLVVEEAGVPGENHRPWAGN